MNGENSLAISSYPFRPAEVVQYDFFFSSTAEVDLGPSWRRDQGDELYNIYITKTANS